MTSPKRIKITLAIARIEFSREKNVTSHNVVKIKVKIKKIEIRNFFGIKKDEKKKKEKAENEVKKLNIQKMKIKIC